jgi:large subunit ribosomal protein L30
VAKIRIIWVKSGIGYARDQRRTLRALGLHRLNQTVVQDDNAALRGQINKVRHLLKVEEANS